MESDLRLLELLCHPEMMQEEAEMICARKCPTEAGRATAKPPQQSWRIGRSIRSQRNRRSRSANDIEGERAGNQRHACP